MCVSCSGLQTVSLNSHVDTLTYFVLLGDYDDGLTRWPREAADLFSNYKLQRLLDCHMLQEINIEQVGYHSEKAEDAAEALGKLLEKKFREMSPSQQVIVTHSRPGSRRLRFY